MTPLIDIENVEFETTGNVPHARNDGHALKADLSSILAGIDKVNVSYKAATIKQEYTGDDKADYSSMVKVARDRVAYCEREILKQQAKEGKLVNAFNLANMGLQSAMSDEDIKAAQCDVDAAFDAIAGLADSVQRAIDRKRDAQSALKAAIAKVESYQAMSDADYAKRQELIAMNAKRLDALKARNKAGLKAV